MVGRIRSSKLSRISTLAAAGAPAHSIVAAVSFCVTHRRDASSGLTAEGATA